MMILVDLSSLHLRFLFQLPDGLLTRNQNVEEALQDHAMPNRVAIAFNIQCLADIHENIQSSIFQCFISLVGSFAFPNDVLLVVQKSDYSPNSPRIAARMRAASLAGPSLSAASLSMD